MVAREKIQRVISPRLNRVLTALELSVSKEKYLICRKVILDEFGNTGLVRDLEDLLGGNGKQEREGSGGPISRRKDGAL